MTWLSRLSFSQAIRWTLLWPVVLAVAVGFALLWDRWTGVEWVIGSKTSAPESHVVLSAYLPTLAIALLIAGPPMAFLLVWRLVRRPE